MFNRNLERLFNEFFNSENPFFGGLNNFEKKLINQKMGQLHLLTLQMLKVI